jgi:phosphate-selective porin OprO and OprP
MAFMKRRRVSPRSAPALAVAAFLLAPWIAWAAPPAVEPSTRAPNGPIDVAAPDAVAPDAVAPDAQSDDGSSTPPTTEVTPPSASETVASEPTPAAHPGPDEPAPVRAEPPPPAIASPPPPAVVSAAATPPADPPSRLRPAGELERMAERPIGTGVFKPGKGLTFETKDKRFSLTLGIVSQFLYTFNDTNPPKKNEQNTSQTFEIRRARLILQGNVFTEHIKYYSQFQFSPRDLGYANGSATITQSPVFLAFATFDRFRDFTVQVGQQWVPYSHQRTAPVTKLQFVDFSMASEEFGLERDIGIDLLSKNFLGLDRLRYHIGAFMGEGVNYAKPHDIGMIYVGRIEYLPLGDFDDYPEVDFNRRPKPKLAISAAYAYDHGDRRTKAIKGATFADGGIENSHNATADVIFKMAGVSMLGDFWFRYGKRKGGGVEDMTTGDDVAIERARNGIGGTAQAGFLIPRVPFEIAGRYSGVRPIGDASKLSKTNEAGPGFSYYFAEHSVKLQLDYFHGWGAHGVRTDRLRLQLTLTF